ncbi:hypothetical protein PSYMO_11685, partial [Pseudomonas amygdali pv. mori str. 301020]
ASFTTKMIREIRKAMVKSARCFAVHGAETISRSLTQLIQMSGYVSARDLKGCTIRSYHLIRFTLLSHQAKQAKILQSMCPMLCERHG